MSNCSTQSQVRSGKRSSAIPQVVNTTRNNMFLFLSHWTTRKGEQVPSFAVHWGPAPLFSQTPGVLCRAGTQQDVVQPRCPDLPQIQMVISLVTCLLSTGDPGPASIKCNSDMASGTESEDLNRQIKNQCILAEVDMYLYQRSPVE